MPFFSVFSVNKMNVTTLDLTVFLVLVIFSMVTDYWLHRENKEVTLGSAIKWTIFWVVIAFVYAGYLWWEHGSKMASLFLSGYMLEKSLSVDNLFVFGAIFAWFNVPNRYCHKVLFWGVIGAIIFRLIFVLIGVKFMSSFGGYADFVFALIIFYAVFKMLTTSEDSEIDYASHPANKLIHKFYPIVPSLFKDKFVVSRQDVEQALQDETRSESDKQQLQNSLTSAKSAMRFATPLFVCLFVIQLSDIMFSFDSVPAVIAVSKEPLIVYSAMLFAILGLRTLYFVLEGLKDILTYLEQGVVFLLLFIGVKLALGGLHALGITHFDITPNQSLFVVVATLVVSVVCSLVLPKKDKK